MALTAKEASKKSALASSGAWSIALAGMVALAVAMGIGRFAFTPILPMMLNDGVLDLPGASWLASANYLGYMLGALLCTLQPWIWSRLRWLPLLAFSTLVRVGLTGQAPATAAVEHIVKFPRLSNLNNDAGGRFEKAAVTR